jgi:autophagy-related protein 17
MRIEFRRISGANVQAVNLQSPNEQEAITGEQEAANRLAPVESIDGDEIIPDLPRDLVEQAFARLKARVKGAT